MNRVISVKGQADCSFHCQAPSSQWCRTGKEHFLGTFLKIYVYRSIIALQCCVSFAAQLRESGEIYIYISPLPWTSLPPCPHPTPPGYHRTWSWAPYVIHSFPLAMYFTNGSVKFICQCFCLNLSRTPLPTPCPQVCSLCLHLYSYLEHLFLKSIKRQQTKNCFKKSNHNDYMSRGYVYTYSHLKQIFISYTKNIFIIFKNKLFT